MKKILLYVFAMCLFCAVSLPAGAQDCPKGIVNDPYPGSCGAYIDANRDDICDHSQTLGSAAPISGEKAAVGAADFASGTEPPIKKNATSGSTEEYYVWQIALALTVAYLLSLLAVKKGRLTAMVNRKIWNLLLLASFAVTALTSVFLLLRSNYGIGFDFPFNLSYWHIEAGLVMMLVSVYHALWHFPYFKSYFNNKAKPA
ncbi:MAG: hypothetical protein MUD10_03580 [Candidatus Pacebacteria bacterium]|jgi:hypothetical protein|nr:hypothetical protein [Candidatus Paceibacterota bacterium]